MGRGLTQLRSRKRVAKRSFSKSDMEGATDLREVLVTFQSCITDKHEVLLDPYIAGWKGLVGFLNTMGSIFTFVSKDAVAKIQIMENFRSSDQKANYVSLQAMVDYELNHGLVDFKKQSDNPPSGCRTILRLHRALRWLQLFLEALRTSSPDSKPSVLCCEAYNASLAIYHPWIIRKAATMAFYALPSRNDFLENMKVGSPDDAVEMLGVALPSIYRVYDITEALYAQHGLLDLP